MRSTKTFVIWVLCVFYDRMSNHSERFTGENMKDRANVILKKGGGRLLKSGGSWIFDNEIAKVEGTFINGDVVSVVDFDGYGLGCGFINANSKIRVRLLSRDPETEINDDFFAERVRAAWEYRKKTVDTSSCRVIFGEADDLPGLTVDKYEDVLAVQSLSLGMDRWKEEIVSILKEVLLADGIRIRGVYERSDPKERLKEGMERKKGFIGEPFDTTVQITENDVKYFVDVENGQKTGFFLDQKYNRKAIWPMAEGAEVLDCFTHTGSFGLNAAKAGAAHVTSVDASESAIAMALKNAEINGFSAGMAEDVDRSMSLLKPDGDTPTANSEGKENNGILNKAAEDNAADQKPQIEYLVADVMELLPHLAEEGKQYDLVILDPPAFAKSKANLKNAVRGYRELNTAGMRLVKRGGFLATCSCSHFMTKELFENMLRDAARRAHVRLRQVEARTQAPDHPILWTAEESSYLKFYIFQIV